MKTIVGQSIKTTPEIKRVVNAALSTGQWKLELGSKHNRIRHTNGRMVTFAASSSDKRAAMFLARDIRHVEQGLPGWGQPQAIEGVASLRKQKYNGPIN